MNTEQAKFVVAEMEAGRRDAGNVTASEAKFILDNVDLSGSEGVRVELENRADNYAAWEHCQG